MPSVFLRALESGKSKADAESGKAVRRERRRLAPDRCWANSVPTGALPVMVVLLEKLWELHT
jgi:hypothetical protein